MGLINIFGGKTFMLKRIRKFIPAVCKKKIKELVGANKVVYSTDKEYIINVSEKGRLNGKVAIITGGSGAIGRAICLRLAIEGAIVYVAGRTETNVNKVVSEISSLGYVANSLILDVSDEKQIEQAFEFVAKLNQNHIDILVNCAGGGARDKATYLHEQSIEVIDSILKTNLRGSMLCSREAAKYMVKQKLGKIVNISSAVGIKGKSRYTDYAAAKAGIIGYTASLAIELGHYGINVNCVSPGYIQRGEFDDSTAEWLKKTNYLEKIGTLEDIASAVSFITSEEAGFITGQNLIVDGGRTLGLHGDN